MGDMDSSSPTPVPPQASPQTSRAVICIAVVVVLVALRLAAQLVLPILIALLLAVALEPVVVWLRRCRLPRALAAALVTMVLVGGCGLGVAQLASPAADWLERAPQSLRQLERKLRPVKQPVDQVRRATEQVEKLAGGGEGPSRGGSDLNLGSLFVSNVGVLAAQAVVMIFLLFFLLASGDQLIRNAARVPVRRGDRRRLFLVLRRIRADLTGYVATISAINLGLGIAAGLAMWALGMPNPALWGAMAGLLNYIPYAGTFLTVAVVALVGLLSFDEIWLGLLPAAAIVVLHILEADLVTPTLIGRRLTLPPLMVFLSLTVWTWMWGIAGTILAVPLLIVLKVIADHVDGLRPVAPFLTAGALRVHVSRRGG